MNLVGVQDLNSLSPSEKAYYQSVGYCTIDPCNSGDWEVASGAGLDTPCSRSVFSSRTCVTANQVGSYRAESGLLPTFSGPLPVFSFPQGSEGPSSSTDQSPPGYLLAQYLSTSFLTTQDIQEWNAYPWVNTPGSSLYTNYPHTPANYEGQSYDTIMSSFCVLQSGQCVNGDTRCSRFLDDTPTPIGQYNAGELCQQWVTSRMEAPPPGASANTVDTAMHNYCNANHSSDYVAPLECQCIFPTANQLYRGGEQTLLTLVGNDTPLGCWFPPCVETSNFLVPISTQQEVIQRDCPTVVCEDVILAFSESGNPIVNINNINQVIHCTSGGSGPSGPTGATGGVWNWVVVHKIWVIVGLVVFLILITILVVVLLI